MAKSNKYSTINFNDIYEKKFTKNNSSTSNPPSSAKNVSKTIISNSRIHGNMLVLTRPTPKPIAIPPPKKQEPEPVAIAIAPVAIDRNRTGSEPDLISLRPQGRTGPGLSLGVGANLSSSSPLPSHVGPLSPLKTNKFIPPHLRPGFVSREEEKPNPRPGSGGKVMPSGGGSGGGGGYRQGHFGPSPNSYGEYARPKSGGGYDRTRYGGGGGGGGGGSRGGETNPGAFMNRPGSSQY